MARFGRSFIPYARRAAAASYPSISTLIDDFSTLDTTNTWNATSGINASGGAANIPVGNSTTNTYALTSKGAYNLTGGALAFQPTFSDAANAQVMELDGANGMRVGFWASKGPTAGYLECFYNAYNYGAYQSLLIQSYQTPVATKWLRIRELLGTIYWEVSPDGKTWTPLATLPVTALGAPINAMTVAFDSSQSTGTSSATWSIKHINVASTDAAQSAVYQNIVPNGSFEHDTTGGSAADWAVGGPSGITGTVAAAHATQGSKSYHTSWTGNAGGGAYPNAGLSNYLTVTPGQTYFFRVDISTITNGSGSAPTLILISYDSSGSYLANYTVGYAQVLAAAGSSGTIAGFITLPASVAQIYPQVFYGDYNSTTDTVEFYLDAFLVTPSTIGIPYADGDTSGWQWTGTVGNSASRQSSVAATATASDSSSTSDATTRVAALVRTASDSSSSTDADVRVDRVTRAASDAALSTDAIVRAEQLTHPVTDVSSSTDTNVRAEQVARTAFDGTVTQDEWRNLVGNPTFEVSTAGWSSYIGSWTLSTSTNWFAAGSQSMLATATASASGAQGGPLINPVSGLVSGAPFTIMGTINATAFPAGSSMQLVMDCFDSTGSVYVGQVSSGAYANPSGVHAFSFTGTLPARSSIGHLYFSVNAGAAGSMSFYCDAIMVALGIVPAYFDGSFPRSRWSGAANNSSSLQTTATRVDALSRTSSDTSASGDVVSRTVVVARSITDASTSIDTTVRTERVARNGTDTSASSDALTVQAAKAVADTSATSDAAVRQAMALARTSSETASTVDLVSSTTAHPRTAADASLSTDNATPRTPNPRTGTDASSSSDADTRVVWLVRTTADATSSTDAATRRIGVSRATSDATLSTDSTTQQLARPRTASDTSSTTDTAVRTLRVVRTLADTTATSDNATRRIVVSRTTSDATATTDSAQGPSARQRSASDASATADSTARNLSLVRAFTDTTMTSDADTRRDVFSRTASDATATGDVVSRQSSRIRAVADTTVVSDTAGRAVREVRGASDTTATVDSAPRRVNYSRTTADATLITDAAVGNRRALRASTDTTATTDLVAVQIISFATARDTSASSDTVTCSVFYVPFVLGAGVSFGLQQQAVSSPQQDQGIVITTL